MLWRLPPGRHPQPRAKRLSPRVAHALVGLCALVFSATAAGQDTTGAIHGSVVGTEHAQPLGFATVTLDSTAASVFADSMGHFRIARVVPGRHRLRARELGYAPLDTTVDIAAGQTVEFTLALTRVPYVLPPVAVAGKTQCRNPGISDSTLSHDVATLATELVVNAQRILLLEKRYPYVYRMESTISVHRENQPWRDDERVDTFEFRSDERHTYRPGDMIDAHLVGRLLNRNEDPHQEYIYLPDLEDVAEPKFISNHCFAFGGVDTVAGQPELRIDFQPVNRMHSADAEGSFFLDPDRFVAKRAIIRMTRGDHEVPPIWKLESHVWYREIAPLIAIEDSATYEQVAGAALWGGELTQLERQRVIEYHARSVKGP